MSAPSPKRVAGTMELIGQIRASLLDSAGKLDIDPEEYLLVLETDTDIMSILDRYEEVVSMQRDYAARARARAQALTKRADAGRRAMQAILEALEAKKIERPTYVASLVKTPARAVIENETAVPFDYMIMTPDEDAILKALKEGQEIPGARLSDPRDTLRISRGKAPAEEIPNE